MYFLKIQYPLFTYFMKLLIFIIDLKLLRTWLKFKVYEVSRKYIIIFMHDNTILTSNWFTYWLKIPYLLKTSWNYFETFLKYFMKIFKPKIHAEQSRCAFFRLNPTVVRRLVPLVCIANVFGSLYSVADHVARPQRRKWDTVVGRDCEISVGIWWSSAIGPMCNTSHDDRASSVTKMSRLHTGWYKNVSHYRIVSINRISKDRFSVRFECKEASVTKKLKR